MPKSSKPHQPPSNSSSVSISRRKFARNAAVIAAASISAPALLPAETPERNAPREQDQKAEPLKGLSAEQTADVDAKLANILRKYGDRFNDDQKKRLRRILAQHQRLLAPVRDFAVKNGDPPASVLRLTFDKVPPKKGGD